MISPAPGPAAPPLFGSPGPVAIGPAAPAPGPGPGVGPGLGVGHRGRAEHKARRDACKKIDSSKHCHVCIPPSLGDYEKTLEKWLISSYQ